jgi:signal transduction histidine kinase
MISHELKTPLVPIKGYAQMLLKPGLLGQTSEKQSKAIQTIVRSSDKLESLIQDILDVYKLDMGKLRLSKVEVEVTDMINQLISDLRPLTDSKKIELSTELKTSGTVLCDQKRIEQVFSNLIKNSVDFVPETGGKIVIRAEEYSNNNNHHSKSHESPYVLFTVEDNGEGIPAEKADGLFKKFYQLDTSAARKHGGTGLGLAICRGLVESHGGKIWVDKTYRNGASIKFFIPRNKSNIATDTAIPTTTTTIISGSSSKLSKNPQDQKNLLVNSTQEKPSKEKEN